MTYINGLLYKKSALVKFVDGIHVLRSQKITVLPQWDSDDKVTNFNEFLDCFTLMEM